MNVLLIFPKVQYAHIERQHRKEILNNIFGEALSLTLPQIAASTQSQHHVSIVDENYEPIDFNAKIDLVGITCLTMAAPRAYEIADAFRSRGIPVILGGNHPSALPDEAKQHADSVVIGEAELTWPRLLEDFEKGQLQSLYSSETAIPPDKIPNPRRDLIMRRITMDGLLIRRGCPNRCEFCTVAKLFHDAIKNRDQVIHEIENITAKQVFIYDQNLTWDIEFLKSLLQDIKRFNKRWLANGTINFFQKNDELLRLAKEANLFYWYIGFESFSQKSLNASNKHHNQVEMYLPSLKKIKEYGMIVNGSFIFGFDEDTVDIFEITSQKLDDLGIDMAEFHVITPFPGTALYTRLKNEKRILTEDWSKYTSANVVFKPKKMSSQQLFEGTRSVAMKFYSIRKILKRSFSAFQSSKDFNIFILVLFRNLRYRERYRNQFNF